MSTKLQNSSLKKSITVGECYGHLLNSDALNFLCCEDDDIRTTLKTIGRCGRLLIDKGFITKDLMVKIEPFAIPLEEEEDEYELFFELVFDDNDKKKILESWSDVKNFVESFYYGMDYSWSWSEFKNELEKSYVLNH